MNDLKKLKNAKVISKKEQTTIYGGGGPRPEICPSTDPIVVCYYPKHCAEGPNGEWICE